MTSTSACFQAHHTPPVPIASSATTVAVARTGDRPKPKHTPQTDRSRRDTRLADGVAHCSTMATSRAAW